MRRASKVRGPSPGSDWPPRCRRFDGESAAFLYQAPYKLQQWTRRPFSIFRHNLERLATESDALENVMAVLNARESLGGSDSGEHNHRVTARIRVHDACLNVRLRIAREGCRQRGHSLYGYPQHLGARSTACAPARRQAARQRPSRPLGLPADALRGLPNENPASANPSESQQRSVRAQKLLLPPPASASAAVPPAPRPIRERRGRAPAPTRIENVAPHRPRIRPPARSGKFRLASPARVPPQPASLARAKACAISS
ncbi:hypothetical protein NUW54_g12254 [Trametes sanguinea]|uniref:Uncharacterized protein n=1 Tax=Trametes sanguinea TaxID=158606 RepID=A0ACC1N232_9APHY|nr:hypothetical protein NUW54_g12254 [Trametes sanguinea]